MAEINRWLLNNLKVGVMGCGQLGQAIARSLVSQGLEKENLLISYKGNPLTQQKLEAQGLAPCLTTNQRLFQEAGLVLITLKPQDILELKETGVSGKALIVSCMAGVPIELLNRIVGTDVYRMMFSGPDTIVSRKGVAAMYPEHEHLKLLLRSINLTHIKTMTETDLNIFTAGVCMPAALLKVENSTECAKAVERIGMEYPLLSELYAWAIKALPHFHNSADKETYIERMITKGGVTDAIINSLTSGAPLDAALRRGIVRTKEISIEIQQSIVNRKFDGGEKMDRLENVIVIKKANVYFDGKVTSRTILLEDGTRKTLGIILPGQYEFGTEDKEHMEVLAGKLSVLLPGSETWASFEAGQTFEIPANCKFKVSANEVSDYCCSYQKE